MTYAKTIVLATLALATLAFTAISAKADTYHHIDTLAVEMQSQSRELLNELREHYRHKPGYAHLRVDALKLYRVAAHIHAIAHVNGSIHHLRDDVEEADQLFHHMESVLHQTDQSYGGHTHGAAHHVFDLVHRIEVTLHHLQSDVKALDEAAHRASRHHDRGNYHGGYGHSRYTVPSNNSGLGYQWGSNGASFNGRGWSFRFGF